MYLQSAEEGSASVSLERPSEPAGRARAAAVSYRLETWMLPGGFRSISGWIDGEPSFLHSLLPAAEVFLTTSPWHSMQIELTDIAGNRAHFRLPRPRHGI